MKKTIAGIMFIIIAFAVCNTASALTITVTCSKNITVPIPGATVDLYYRYNGDKDRGSASGTADNKGVCKFEKLPNLTWVQAHGYKLAANFSALSAERFDVNKDIYLYCNVGLPKVAPQTNKPKPSKVIPQLAH